MQIKSDELQKAVSELRDSFFVPITFLYTREAGTNKLYVLQDDLQKLTLPGKCNQKEKNIC